MSRWIQKSLWERVAGHSYHRVPVAIEDEDIARAIENSIQRGATPGSVKVATASINYHPYHRILSWSLDRDDRDDREEDTLWYRQLLRDAIKLLLAERHGLEIPDYANLIEDGSNIWYELDGLTKEEALTKLIEYAEERVRYYK